MKRFAPLWGAGIGFVTGIVLGLGCIEFYRVPALADFPGILSRVFTSVYGPSSEFLPFALIFPFGALAFKLFAQTKILFIVSAISLPIYGWILGAAYKAENLRTRFTSLVLVHLLAVGLSLILFHKTIHSHPKGASVKQPAQFSSAARQANMVAPCLASSSPKRSNL